MATFLQVPRDIHLSATCNLSVYSNIYLCCTGDRNELAWQNSSNFDYHIPIHPTTTSDCILCGDFKFLVEDLWILGWGVLRKE